MLYIFIFSNKIDLNQAIYVYHTCAQRYLRNPTTNTMFFTLPLYPYPIIRDNTVNVPAGAAGAAAAPQISTSGLNRTKSRSSLEVKAKTPFQPWISSCN
jgi:hypothetical protein